MYVAVGCSSCHGNDAYGTEMDLETGFPALRGLDKDYIIQQLEDFQSGERQNPIMNAMAPMVEGYEIDIAEYLSSLSSEDTVELEITVQIN
jgi:cytochrome c553